MRVFIEGNIGAGKSTFLEYLRQHFNEFEAEFIPEPIEKWQNFNGYNLLSAMYEYPDVYGTPFQMYALLTTFEILTKTADVNLAFIERSVLSMKHCFIPTLCTFGLMHDATCRVFDAWFDFIIENQNFEPDIIIYIKTSPWIVFGRIKKRNRQGEKEIDLNHLLFLQNKHERWMNEMIDNETVREFKGLNGQWIMTAAFGGFDKTVLITLNGDLSGSELIVEYDKCLKRLKRIIKILKR